MYDMDEVCHVIHGETWRDNIPGPSAARAQ